MAEYNFQLVLPNGVSPQKLQLEGARLIGTSGENVILQQLPESPTPDVVCAAHVPDSTPWCNLYIKPPNSTAANLLAALAAHNVASIHMDSHIYITFNVIPDHVAVAQILATYVEPPPKIGAEIYSVGDVLKTDTQILRTIQSREIIVAQNGTNYTNITTALQDVSGPTVIRIYPGIYMEQNPLVLPNNCSLVGEGNAGNVIIVATTAQPLLICGEFCNVDRVCLIGGTVGLQFNGANVNAFTTINDVIIKDSAIGVYAYGGLGSVVLNNLSIISPIGIKCDGASVIGSRVILQGVITRGVELLSGIINFIIISIYTAQQAIYIKNANFKCVYSNIINCVTGVYIDTSTIVPEVDLSFLLVRNCTTDLNIRTNTNLKLFTSSIDEDKIINTSTTIVSGFVQDFYGQNYQMILGDLYIGTDTIPSNVTIGESYDTTIFKDTDTYIGTNHAFYGISSTTLLSDIFYHNGSGWQLAKSSRNTITKLDRGTTITMHDYAIDADIPQVKTLVSGNEMYWLKITGINAGRQTALPNGKFYNSRGLSRKYGTARTYKYIHLSPGDRTFLPPPNMDISTKYSIYVEATNITVLNGLSPNTPTAEVFVYAETKSKQTFTLSGTGINLIVIKYLSF